MMRLLCLCSVFCFLIEADISSQVAPDRHSLVAGDQWLSCQASPSPNAARGNSHWIMYDLGYVYPLHDTRFWNYNHPNALDMGLQNIAIDVSEDGSVWTQAAEFVLEAGNGSGFYEGIAGPDLMGNEARFVLITGLSNHGGECFGFGEFKANVAAIPLPVDFVKIEAYCDPDLKPKVVWAVANEVNLENYIVERSTDANHWDAAAEIKIPLWNSFPEVYSYKDSDYESGLVYYRVRSMDKEGIVNTTNIVKAKCKDNLVNYLISPNPVTQVLNLKVEVLKPTSLEIMIHDSESRTIKHEYRSIRGAEGIDLDLAGLMPGIYTLQLTIEQEVYLEKFIKLD